jgi:micrococcal nuclease
MALAMSIPREERWDMAVTSEQIRTRLYHYRARVTAVYDGDTCTVDIDLGLGTWIKGEKIRLHRINAPELRGTDAAAGRAARDFLRNLVLDKDVLLQTIKDAREKYGRYLAEVWVEQANQPMNVNDTLVTAGHARYQAY